MKIYKRVIRILSTIIALTIVQFFIHSLAQAATISVSNNSDSITIGCTLREAITSINLGVESGCKSVGTFGVDDTIEFGGALYNQTIYLTSALPTIVKDVTIKGLG